MSTLPAATSNLLGFARLLRKSGFIIAPEQIMSFMQSVSLLGPRSIEDIRRAASAALAPLPERMQEFDALFRTWFWGEGIELSAGDEDEPSVADEDGLSFQFQAGTDETESGEAASAEELLGVRKFSHRDISMQQLARALPAALPLRRSFRNIRTSSRGHLDLRRSFRAIIRADGDIPRPYLRKRALIQRKLLMLIDISGSMKSYSEGHMRLAHTIVQVADQVEVFTLGTRLSRITPALRIRDWERALARAAETVEDWDGGTRIGSALQSLLALPRFSAFARGASIVLLSDGLERGSHAEFELAMRRLSLRAHRLSLCTPLAGDRRYSPQTAALTAILPLLDDLVDGSSVDRIASFVLALARPAPAAISVWRKSS